MAGNYNFEMHIGDSWPFGPTQVVTVLVREGPVGGPYTPIDLTGSTLSAEFTADPDLSEELCVATIVMLDQGSNTGEFTFWYPATETDKLIARVYHYKFIVDFTGDRILTPLHGQFRATNVG